MSNAQLNITVTPNSNGAWTYSGDVKNDKGDIDVDEKSDLVFTLDSNSSYTWPAAQSGTNPTSGPIKIGLQGQDKVFIASNASGEFMASVTNNDKTLTVTDKKDNTSTYEYCLIVLNGTVSIEDDPAIYNKNKGTG